jgi:CheY-like chemotaxis protein
VVKDFGSGIPADQLEEIFTTFVQLEDPGNGRNGLGLGLALARRLVGLHGGTVKARSRGRGLGSEFEVRLPRSCAVAAQAPSAGFLPLAPGLDRAAPLLTILVVDDNDYVVSALAALLKMDGHRVWTAGTGADALMSASAHAPDLVILDISLPDMNGHAIARALRQSNTDRVPKIIAMTGWSANEAGLDDAAFDTFLSKPVSYEALNKTISELSLTEPASSSL